MRCLAVALAVLLLLPLVHAANPLNVNVRTEDMKSFASDLIASSPEVRQILGGGDWVVEFRVLTGKGVDRGYAIGRGGEMTDFTERSSRNPDLSVVMSRDAWLSLLNSPDRPATFKRLLNANAVEISSASLSKKAAIKAALSSGLLKAEPLHAGSQFAIGGSSGTAKDFFGVFRVKVGDDDYVVNGVGAPIGFLGRAFDRFASPPPKVPVFFKKPPGVLAQNPGLIYDTVTNNPNVMGPHNVFKINPGLKGPNDILRLNPGLIGPADIAMLNPNLHGPKEFAYLMGIGAHSNTARHLQQRGLVNDPTLGMVNRWNATR